MSRLSRTMVEQFVEGEKAKARKEMDSCMDKIFGQMKRKLMQFVAGQDNSRVHQLYTNSKQTLSTTQPSSTFNPHVISSQQEDDDEMNIVRNELGENINTIIPNEQSNLIEIIGNDSENDDLFIEDEDENQDCDCSDCVVELCVVKKEVDVFDVDVVQQQREEVEVQVQLNVNSSHNSKQNLNSVSTPATKRARLEKVPRNPFVPRTILVSSTNTNQQPNPNPVLNPQPTSPIHRVEKPNRFVPRTILIPSTTNNQPNLNPLNPPPTSPIPRLEKPNRFVPRTILIQSTNTHNQPNANPLNPSPTSSPNLKCRKCARMFDDVNSVNAHLKDVHSIGLFKCGFTDKDKDCTRTFNNKLALEHHYRITHHRVYLPAD